ncbi:MAG: tRNA lysidine(34) synthetase TilS [Pelagibacteraceae bacterium]|nr:tRNA lysidine(34) synthetase TilS [Pelagibacteraceae bacterium]|tara:strand:+ start:20843 stop:21805 length:963 start_codon:yes stop_codon:yes gene_type:complete
MLLNYNNFTTEINKIGFFENKAKIAVGVSGGPDSIVLAFLLSKFAKIKGYTVIALIVNHNLRLESSQEAKEVSDYLTRNKINNKVLSWRRKKNKKASQEKARNARFEILHNYCKNNNIIHLFLGHHFDDNLETFILRKIAGSDIEGLNSMNSEAIFEKVRILRPMLNCTKESIIRFAKKNNLQWIKDPSNENMSYSRSKIRYEIENTLKFKKIAKKDFENKKLIYIDYLSMINRHLSYLITKITNNKVEINKNYFCKLPKGVAIKILVILTKYVHNNSIRIKNRKIDLINTGLSKKNSNFRTHSTIFASISNKIDIYPIK